MPLSARPPRRSLRIAFPPCCTGYARAATRLFLEVSPACRPPAPGAIATENGPGFPPRRPARLAPRGGQISRIPGGGWRSRGHPRRSRRPAEDSHARTRHTPCGFQYLPYPPVRNRARRQRLIRRRAAQEPRRRRHRSGRRLGPN